MTFFGVKLSIVLVAALVISSCSAKFTGFVELDGLLETYVQHSNMMTVCETCNYIVRHIWDNWRHAPPETKTTPEKLAAYIKDTMCPHAPPGLITVRLCKAIAGKEDVFAKAYFDLVLRLGSRGGRRIRTQRI